MGKQHYLSQAYLKGFSSNSEDEIFCYDKQRSCYITRYNVTDNQINTTDKITKTGKISSLGCNRDGFWNHDTEDAMGKIESTFGKSLYNFNQSGAINNFSHEVLMSFILLQLVRSQFTSNIDYIEPVIQEYRKNGITKKEINNSKHLVLNNKEWRSKLILEFITGRRQWKDAEKYTELINRNIHFRRINKEQNCNLITTNFPFIHNIGCIEFPLSSNMLLKIAGEGKSLILDENTMNTNEILDINKNIVYSNTDNRYIFGKRNEDIMLSMGTILK